jgi:4-carboxymuconolactone decarboxylase
MSLSTEPMAQPNRISFPTPETMTPDQKAVFDDIVSGPRGTLVGPLRAALHNPVLADRWQKLGRVLRFETSMPARLNELAILVTARRWNSDLEWAIHAGDARRAGLDESYIESLREGSAPNFGDDAPAKEVYTYARELLTHGALSDDTHRAVTERWGDVGVVELTATIGYYSMVAMTLNAHLIPLPNGVTERLPQAATTLSTIPGPQ